MKIQLFEKCSILLNTSSEKFKTQIGKMKQYIQLSTNTEE